MSQEIQVNGIVLSSTAYSEYDRRITLLTKELGKITAFVRGVRRANSQLHGVTEPFAFGTFYLFGGRSAYSLARAEISDYFRNAREDLEKSCYGSYFMELAAYYGRENLDASAMLNLLYVTMKALEKPTLPDDLVRYVYEIRLMVINGEYPQHLAQDPMLCEAARAAVSYAISAPLGRLYTFTLSEEAMRDLKKLQEYVRPRIIDARIRSLDVLNQMQQLRV